MSQQLPVGSPLGSQQQARGPLARRPNTTVHTHTAPMQYVQLPPGSTIPPSFETLQQYYPGLAAQLQGASWRDDNGNVHSYPTMPPGPVPGVGVAGTPMPAPAPGVVPGAPVPPQGLVPGFPPPAQQYYPAYAPPPPAMTPQQQQYQQQLRAQQQFRPAMPGAAMPGAMPGAAMPAGMPPTVPPPGMYPPQATPMAWQGPSTPGYASPTRSYANLPEPYNASPGRAYRL